MKLELLNSQLLANASKQKSIGNQQFQKQENTASFMDILAGIQHKNQEILTSINETNNANSASDLSSDDASFNSGQLQTTEPAVKNEASDSYKSAESEHYPNICKESETVGR